MVGGALEQPGAEFAFQRPDRDGQGRLHEVNTCRGPGEAAFLGDRDKVLEMTQLHFMLQIDDSHAESSLDSITTVRKIERSDSGAAACQLCGRRSTSRV